MELNNFQLEAAHTGRDYVGCFETDDPNVHYLSLSNRLGEEAGEVLGAVKRYVRAGSVQAADTATLNLASELADLLHAVAQLAFYADITMEELSMIILKKQTKKGMGIFQSTMGSRETV